MRFAIEIGNTEKHRLEYNFNQLLGSLVIKVNDTCAGAGNRAALARLRELAAADRRILVSISMTEELFSDMMWPIENLARDIESEFYARLGIEAEVTFFSPRNPT